LRVVALFAAYNERRFVRTFLEHLRTQNVDAYMIDNDSTDETVRLAEPFLGRGLIAIERLPRADGLFRFRRILERMEEVALELAADWFLLTSPDERVVSPYPGLGVAEALAKVELDGYDAVNLFEFSFVPTREHPDHDHGRFAETMRRYYPFAPKPLHRLSCWRRQSERVTLAASAGHRIDFPGLSSAPDSFPLLHYLFLSRAHAVEKYAGRLRDAAEEAAGWGGWRNVVARSPLAGDPSLVPLPGEGELRVFSGEGSLDPSEPLTRHVWAERWAEALVAHEA